jgi:hypothetical protein
VLRLPFFKKNNININTYRHTNIHSYKYTYISYTIITSKKLNRLDLEIHIRATFA